MEVTKKHQCVKSVQIPSFSGPYLPVFGLNTEKYGQKKLRIWTLFTQCIYFQQTVICTKSTIGKLEKIVKYVQS